MIYKLSVSSQKQIPLELKKKYVDAMFAEEMSFNEGNRNQGFIHKFNNAVGFKDVISQTSSTGVVTSPKVESKEDYRPPKHLLLEAMQTPVDSLDILVFYVENQHIRHEEKRYSYYTKDIMLKLRNFLSKVFPELIVHLDEVDSIPILSLKEFALQHFYLNISFSLNCTIEFSSETTLSEAEMGEIIEIIQPLSQDKITIAQYKCDTCSKHSNGKKPYHIELAYLSWYGKDIEEKTYEEYGDKIYKLN